MRSTRQFGSGQRAALHAVGPLVRWLSACAFLAAVGGATGCGNQRGAPAVQPARIVGPSMAQRLAGEHVAVACGDCGFAFRCGIEHPPARGLAVCPNCGYAQNAFDASQTQPGMEVRIIPRDWSASSPRRGEIVAFHEPGDARLVAVKRVVGLPGETIAIRRGDLFINGRRFRKSLAQLLAVAQSVHDDRFRPKPSAGLPPRWAPELKDSRWRAVEGGYQFASSGPPAVPAEGRAGGGDGRVPAATDWLRYHHWLCAEDPARRAMPSPVLDDYAYDQGLARQHNPVRDLLLTCRLRWLDGGPLAIAIHGGREELTVMLDQSENLITLHRGQQQLAEAPSTAPLVGDWLALAVAVCDGRVLVGINGDQMLAHPIEDPRGEAAPPGARPLAIGTGRANLEIRDLKVLRDLHYLDPNGRADDWEFPSALAADEYFLLGDNAPSSRDSRQFGPIRRAALVGGVEPVQP